MPTTLRLAGVAAILLGMANESSAQRAGFVVRLGRDTIAVEQFTRSGGRVEGELLRRSPVTHLIRYTVNLRPDGLPAELTFTIERPAGQSPRGAVRGGRVVFDADSSRIELQRDTLQVRRVAARGGTPTLPESYELYEVWLERLMQSGQDSLAVVLVAPLGGPGGAATDAERIARYNALTMNSGTYTLSGNRLIIRPLVARAPEYVGGTGTYEFQVTGDTLQLTDIDIVSFDTIPIPGFVATGRYHHTLVRLR